MGRTSGRGPLKSRGGEEKNYGVGGRDVQVRKKKKKKDIV